MEAAILFCGARRTDQCQRALSAGGFSAAAVRAADSGHVVGELAALLPAHRLVLLVGPARGGDPSYGGPVFSALGVALRGGRPDGVLHLRGDGACGGFLVESPTQAVAVLPDLPAALAALLPELSLRLRQKFGLPAPPPGKPVPDFSRLMDAAPPPGGKPG